MTTVVKIASYNSISGAYNGEVIETEWSDYRIIARPNEPAESIITVEDPTGSIMQTYGVNLTKDLAGAVADDGGVETDETTEANEDTADDMTIFPNNQDLNDAYYFGFTGQVSGFTLDISTAGTAVTAVLDWEYSQGGDSWAALAGGNQGDYNDLGDFTVAEHDISWTIPGDWATDEVGGISGVYWVRLRVTTAGTPLADSSPRGRQAWTSEVYIGPGRITIDKGGTIYDGRILKTSFDDGARAVQLHCKDWLSQHADPVITYDMREDIDGSGLREAEAHSDVDGAFIGVARNNAGTFEFYDDGDYAVDGQRGWANDAFNGKRLVLASSMMGKKTWRFHPYQSSTTDADNTVTGLIENVWRRDGEVNDTNDNGDYVLDYDFRVELGHNTPSDFYVHESITGARVGVRYKVSSAGVDHTHLEIEDQSNPGNFLEFQTLQEDDHFIDLVHELDSTDFVNLVGADGEAKIRFDVEAAGAYTLGVSFLYIEVDVETIGYSQAVTINDTINPNKLEVATDLTAAAQQIWELIPYSIVQEVHKHISTVEGGTLITGYDPLVALTASTASNVEATTGFSTRRYENSTPLFILQDSANIDKTAFCLPLGSLDLLWKSTFNDGAPTAMTDDSVIKWSGEHSFIDVHNGYILYGPKINDNLLRVDTADISPDPGVDSKATYGVTRSAVVKNSGVTSEYELTELGGALVERDEDVLLFLNCDIEGLSALRLLDEVSITSTYMGLVAEKYVVTYWEYAYSENITKLRLHPRNSTKGFVQHRIFSDSIRRLAEATEQVTANVDYLQPERTTD